MKQVEWIETRETGDHFYLVSEYMNQGSLQDYMARKRIGYVSEDELQIFAGAIVQALATVHSHGFSHNGLHPGSILLSLSTSKGFQVKLGGFSHCTRVDQRGLSQTRDQVRAVSATDAPEV